MKKIKIIFLKELKDMFRDRRTMFFMIVFPAVIMPLMMTAVPKLFADAEKKEKTKILNVEMIGAEYASDLYQFLQSQEDLSVSVESDTSGMNEKLSDGTVDIILFVSETFDSDIVRMNPTEMFVYYDSQDDMNITERRIRKLLNIFSETIIDKRFVAMDIEKDVLSPLNVSYHNFASTREIVGKMIGGFLPYLFVLFCFMGAMYPAVDLGAGEKERGTLETLLISPASRTQILLGKFGVVTLSGLASPIFGFLGIFVAITRMADSTAAPKIMEIAYSILQPETIILVLTLIIPVAVFFSALLLSLSIYAKTFKEAQSIIGPLNIVFIVPVLIGLVPGIKLDYITAMVPILNISLATKEVIAGTVNYWLLAEVYVVMFALAAASLAFALRWFKNENVIFRV